VRVLFVVSRLPYPPWRGDQVRAFHQLRHLAPRHEITVCLVGKIPSAAHRSAVEALGVTLEVIPMSAPGAVARMSRAPLDRRPAQALAFTSQAARRRIESLAGSADLIHAQLIRTAPLLPETGPPVVVDLIDAMSVNLRRRAAHDRSFRGLAARWEARRILVYEAGLVRRGMSIVAATAADAAALGSGVGVIPNGVDLDHFSFRAEGRDATTLVFAGNLGYFPNVDAARIAATEVLPIVRQSVPTANLILAGARPSRLIHRLARLPGVALISGPADLGAVVAGAGVAVVPMRAGTGMQNKVLEAMAVGTPVVTTPRAAEAVGAVPGIHLRVGEDPAAIASAVLAILDDPTEGRSMAARARHFVEERFGWPASAEALEQVWERARAGR
jgi:glycosyltransferase involved in cell wall biosynthesis